MNQIARGGYSLTPPAGGTTGVPLASGLRGQTPPSSSNLEGIEPLAPHRCARPGIEPMIFRYYGNTEQANKKPAAKAAAHVKVK